MKQSTDDNFEFDENTRKVSKRVENTVGKGEIARLEQFLLYPQCFQKACFPGASKGVIVWEWVKCLSFVQNIFLKMLKYDLTLYGTTPIIYQLLVKQSVENTDVAFVKEANETSSDEQVKGLTISGMN